jgi:uncharacterized protein
MQEEADMAPTQEPTQAVVDEFVGVAHGDFGRVQALLAHYPSLVNASATWGETAIAATAQVGRQDIAEYLLDAGAPLDICTAAMLGMSERVAAMLEADPSLAHATGAHGIPVLYYPVIRNRADIAALLLESGADVNAGEGHTTPLHGAVTFDQPAMAGWLLAHGALVNAPSYDSKTPLRLAREKGHVELADLLREHGGVEAFP